MGPIILEMAGLARAAPEAGGAEAEDEPAIAFGSVAEWAMWAIENRELPISSRAPGQSK